MSRSSCVRVGLFLAVALVSQLSRASGPILFNGQDISPAVDYFAPMITPLKKSVTLYSWSMASQQYQSSFDVLDAQSRARRFWHKFGSQDGSNDMYGTGLYGAADPATTEGYGGGGDSWHLLVMKLPVGFRLLDLPRLNSAALPALKDPVANVMKSFGCPTVASPDLFFQNGGLSLTSNCRDLVQEIFSHQLAMDGLGYSYSMTPFKSCTNDWNDSYRAFVIATDGWMNDSTVHFYSSKSTENLGDRIMIQTILLEAADQSANTDGLFDPIATYLIAHPQSQIVSSASNCTGSQCVIAVHFCDDKNQCDDLNLAPIPRPGGPNLAASATQPLIWSDLAGLPKSTTTAVYLQSTDFGCDGTLPYTH